MTRFRLAAVLVGLGLAMPFAGSAEDAPGVFKIPGTDSTIKFYGYVQTDVTFDFRARDPNVEGNDWAVHTPNLPLDGSAEATNKKNQLYMTARTSRFGLETNTPTAIGAIGVKLEGDFNAVNLESGQTFTNSMLFRLRHAYGTWNSSYGTLLVGQTWSNFLDLASYPDTVDFNGPGTIALVRNPMIKYTFKIPGASGVSLAISAENAPGTDGNDFNGSINSDGSSNTTRMQTIPDFTANLGFSGPWGSASLRGVTVNNRFAGSTTVPNLSQVNKQGFGGAASAALKLGGDTFVVHGVYGGGIARYIFDVGLSTGAVVANGTDLVNVQAGGVHAGYTHVWNPQWRSNLVGAITYIKNPEINGAPRFDNGTNEQLIEGFVNTFYTFAKNAEFGLEYEWGRRKTFSPNEQFGHQSRVTGTFHYNFF